MDGFSSYDVALRVARARPGKEHVDAVLEVFEALDGDGVDTLPSERRPLGDAVAAVVAATPDADHGALAYGAAFVAAAMDSPGDPIPQGEASLAIASLAGLSQVDPDLEVKSASRSGGFAEADIPRVASAVHDAAGVPDDLVERFSGVRPSFPEPTDDALAFAEEVIGFSGEGIPSDPKVARASLAAAAINIDPASRDAGRIGSALSRASLMPDDASIADMSIALASDIASQGRAMRILEGKDIDGMPEATLEAVRLDAVPGARSDLEAEAQGRFHDLSRGAARDLRMDMASGGNLSSETLDLIRANVSRLEEWQSSLSASRDSAQETVKPLPPMPQREAMEL